MKKRIACLLSALLVLSCTTPVLANPSAATKQPEVKVETAVEGVKLSIEQEVNESVKKEAKEEATKAAAAVSADTTHEVVAVVEINLEAGAIPEGGLKITLKVDGVEANDNIVLLHKDEDKKDGEKWEIIKPDAVRKGEIDATFGSFSPVAIVKLAATTTGSAAPETAPKAGASFVLPVAALVCAAGATVCGRKVKFN